MDAQTLCRTTEIVMLLHKNAVQDIALFFRMRLCTGRLFAVILLRSPHICHCDLCPVCKQHETLHHVLQLADVARPWTYAKKLNSFVRDARYLPVQMGKTPHETPCQKRNVGTAFGECGHVDAQNIQAVVLIPYYCSKKRAHLKCDVCGTLSL